MSSGANYIVFQCYGNKGVFHECAFALLSLSRLYPDGLPSGTEIWIYTDDAAWFDGLGKCPLPMQFCALDATTLKSWRGGIDFVHRVKIALLQDLCTRATGNILYADTDVVFMHPITTILEGIAQGNRYMHVMEGRVSDAGNPVLKKLHHHLLARKLTDAGGRPLQDLYMWNAGVLGFSTHQAGLLDRVLAFTDAEYPLFSKHIVEQFAFSVHMAGAGAIKAASPYVLHYWNLKEVRPLLADFFEAMKGQPWKVITQAAALIQMPVLMQEKANFYQNRSIGDKLQKKVWTPTAVPASLLLQQL
jgi:hypothetical protein